jgi:two-component system NtrC family sensor kinase
MSSRYPYKWTAYKRRRLVCLLLVGLLPALGGKAQSLISIKDTATMMPIGRQLEVLRADSTHAPDTATVMHNPLFRPSTKDIPNFTEYNIHHWLRFSATNQTDVGTLFLTVQTPILPDVRLYKVNGGHLQLLSRTGARYPFYEREITDVNFVFNLELPPGDTAQYYLSVLSDRNLVMPVLVGTRYAMEDASDTNVFTIGTYFGILLVIFFYNLFIYFSVNDRSYLTYIVYIFFLGMSQLTSSGFGFRYLWPYHPELNQYILVFFSNMVCITAIIFAVDFLQIRKYTPRVMWAVGYFLASYTLAIGANLLGYNKFSINVLNINALLMGVMLIPASAYIAMKGFRTAYFYLVAWTLVFLGLIAWSLKNYGIIPSNQFTNYILYIGSSLEAILLSIALGDKINVLKREKQQSQEQALEISQENERLVREQNLILEAKVHERTVELEDTNRNLNDTLEHLKATQSQLVESEKMASLGVLTAGIAHEINNPINFVKSNIKPLQLDIQDLWEVINMYEKIDPADDLESQVYRISAYKQKIDMSYIREEIVSLLQGIEDGATRTAEIVKGLRTFSRLDETELKKVNLFEGLDSTLVLLRSSMPVNIQVIRNYEIVPSVECFPGKLNQVFMNIMGNAVYAMEKKHSGEPEYLTVGTYLYDMDHVAVRIADTGMGMPDSVKEKIFDPFFTTKEIGEGTGLGLSIVFSIIEKHKGKIIVHSTMGAGTEFLIILPIVHPSN